MTGRDPQPTTRRRSNGACLATITTLPLRALLLATSLLAAPPLGFAQDVPVRGGSAGSAGGSVGEIGGVASGTGEERKPASTPEQPPAPEPQTPAVPLVSPIAEPAAPPFHVSEVNVEGTVVGDRADLTVRINVEVNRAGSWFDVPLRLGQAHIYKESSSGVGSRQPGQPALQDDGLHWRFYGQGQHTLEFQLGVPVRSGPSGRQMQLSLPVMPPLFEAQVRLKLPGGNFVIRSPGRDATLKTEYDASKNETTVVGGSSGGRLELSWQDRNLRPPADGIASTIYTIRRRNFGWDMEAVQTLIRMESMSNDFLVRVPEGFELDKIEGSLYEDRQEVAGRPGWFKVSFVEGTSDRIDLRWHLHKPFVAGDSTLNLSGFEIEGVRTHDGRIRIMPVPGTQLLPRPSSMRYVERIEDVPPLGESASLFTYAFSASDWRLSLELRPVEPLFASRPRVELQIAEDLATLTATYEIREEAGDVTRMVVDVGALEAAGWTLPAGRPNLSGATTTRSGSVMTFEWPAASGGRKTAELRYERPLSGAEFSFTAPIPIPRATWTDPAVVLVKAADALRVDVTGATPSSDSQLEVAPSESSRLIGVYQAADGKPLEVHASVEALTKSATANILVEAVESRRVTIEQQIMLDVRYGRMDALRLLLPEGFPVTPGAERLAFQVWVDGREATDLEWTSGTIRVPFARPRIGLIRVSIRYALPKERDQAALSIPVVLTPDVKYHDLTMEAVRGARVAVDAADDNWKEIVTSSDRRKWSADPQADSIALVFEGDRLVANERAVIAAAFVQTELTAGGIHRTVASYEIERSGETLAVMLPPAATLHEILIDGRPGETVRPTPSTPENLVTVRMPASGGGGASRRLLIRYDVVPSAARGAIGRVRFEFPRFPAATFVDQLIWRLVLPETDVLFSSPPGMTHLFEWQRKGVFWRRSLSPEYSATLRNLGFELLPADEAGEGYAFRQIGSPASLVVWTIDRSLVILIGAGVTLILGFAFWTVRSLQNVIVLLLLAFLVSLVGLWFPEAIQVLLQPALVGVAMAMVATAIDGRTRRRRYRAPVRESSIQQTPRSQSPRVNDPLRSTILRPTGSDHGVPR
jgi:hypothetical protein